MSGGDGDGGGDGGGGGVVGQRFCLDHGRMRRSGRGVGRTVVVAAMVAVVNGSGGAGRGKQVVVIRGVAVPSVAVAVSVEAGAGRCWPSCFCCQPAVVAGVTIVAGVVVIVWAGTAAVLRPQSLVL